jgi:Cd2+/Zn2+-exporting ATPase
MTSTTSVTKTYTLEGLGCASCAAKIERAVQVLEGVSGASINLINSKLQVETDENHSESISVHVEKIVHKYEPHVVVILHDKKEHRHEEHEHKDCCEHEHMHESNDDLGDCCGHEHEAHEHEHDHDHSDSRSEHDQSHISRNRAHEHSGDKEGKKQITVILIGGLIFAAGLILQNVFVLEEYVRFIIFLTAYIILGGRIVLRAAKNITRGQVFDENFLMSIATIGAFIIREFPEAVAVMLF